MTMMLTVLVGLMCVAASFLRLGANADFLSKPILVGFMNGLALSIVLGQMRPLFGISLESIGFFPRVYEFMVSLSRTHSPTLGVGLISLSALLAAQRHLPRIPAALVAMAVAAVVAQVFRLERSGIAVIGLVALRDAFDTLRDQGIVVAAAGRDAEWADRAARRDLSGVLTGIRFFPTLRLAEFTYRAETDDLSDPRPLEPRLDGTLQGDGLSDLEQQRPGT